MCSDATSWGAIVAALLVLAAPPRVEGQDSPSPAQPTPDSQTSETAETRQARELTARARDRFEAGDFAAALVEFSRAHERLPGHPRRAELLNNIAVCHERMFHYDLALQYYRRYLAEGAPSPADRAEVEAVIHGLQQLLGKVHITSNVRAELWMDNRTVGTAPGVIQVPAGTRVVEARASGYQAIRRELQVVARATRNVHLELEPLPQYHGIDRRYFWVGASLTGVALITGAGLGLTALSKQRDAEALQREGLLTHEEQQTLHNLELAADVAFGTAALLAVGSTVLFFLTDFQRQRRDLPPSQRTVRVSTRPALGPGALRLVVAGAW